MASLDSADAACLVFDPDVPFKSAETLAVGLTNFNAVRCHLAGSRCKGHRSAARSMPSGDSYVTAVDDLEAGAGHTCSRQQLLPRQGLVGTQKGHSCGG